MSACSIEFNYLMNISQSKYFQIVSICDILFESDIACLMIHQRIVRMKFIEQIIQVVLVHTTIILLIIEQL